MMSVRYLGSQMGDVDPLPPFEFQCPMSAMPRLSAGDPM